VTGARTADGERVAGDLVVDATGRRSPLARWLQDCGAPPPAEEMEDSGFVYYCRLSRNDWANFRAWARHPDADEVIAELEASGSLTPGLSWYRANLPPEALLAEPAAIPPVQAPTLGIWSSKDIALTEAQMTGSADHVSGPWRYERIDGIGHWMQLEAPLEVNRLLPGFLRS
jgi:pimeloyl-ACP methyl ester carboxylesterase